MAISSLFVEPSSKLEEYLPSDHPLQKIITIVSSQASNLQLLVVCRPSLTDCLWLQMNNEFPAAQWDSKVQAELVFGIDPETRKFTSNLPVLVISRPILTDYLCFQHLIEREQTI